MKKLNFQMEIVLRVGSTHWIYETQEKKVNFLIINFCIDCTHIDDILVLVG